MGDRIAVSSFRTRETGFANELLISGLKVRVLQEELDNAAVHIAFLVCRPALARDGAACRLQGLKASEG